jgi:hypothetical protein
MVEKVNDPLALSDYHRTLLGKAATRIELPLITHEKGDALAPSDWADIFAAIRAWVNDCEFEARGRGGEAIKLAAAVEYRTKTLNRELRFIRGRARKAAEDRKREALEDKVRTIRAFGERKVG